MPELVLDHPRFQLLRGAFSVTPAPLADLQHAFPA